MLTPETIFSEAAPQWLTSRCGRIAPNTFEDYEFYLRPHRPLMQFFGAKQLGHITGEDLQAYQAQRSETAGASLVNHELGMLLQIGTTLWGVDVHGGTKIVSPSAWLSRRSASTEESAVSMKTAQP